ncbi:MAG: hypothetical protein ACYC0X_22595 [Pirellulaceae bacterium]
MISQRANAISNALLVLHLLIAVASGDQPAAQEAAVQKSHPWRPPFGLDAVGRSGVSGFDAALDLSVTPVRHPLSVGVIFPKHGTLVACVGDRVVVRLAAFEGEAPSSAATFVMTLHDADRKKEQVVLTEPLVMRERQREEFSWSFVMPADFSPRATLHCAILGAGGTARWQTELPVVCTPAPLEWPEFGATSCQLAYDLPISVRDPATGSFSEIPYSQGWDPALQDVVVSLPGGGQFVFWRGACYIPFWARPDGLGVCYEWAEMSPPHPPDAVDCIEPLMDKELRYGRVRIVESTSARVHVQWRYQSCDLEYRVWGDEAVEDYYFYPDGFGTRVLTLKSTPDAAYEIAELILLLPPARYPLDAAPHPHVEALFLDSTKRDFHFPVDANAVPDLIAPGPAPALFRLRARDDDREAVILFHPTETRMPPAIFAPFMDAGHMVTPAYWGSHWPLARGNMTGGAIDERLHVTPSHVSLMSWAFQRPDPIQDGRHAILDALGRSRLMEVRQWAWLIGMTDDDDESLRARARSFAQPPSSTVKGAQLAFEPWVTGRRAICIECPPLPHNRADANLSGNTGQSEIELELQPHPVLVDPVFEIDNAPGELTEVIVNGRSLAGQEYRWDGDVLWIKGTWSDRVKLALRFVPPAEAGGSEGAG